MGDFVQKSVTRLAVREFATPLESASALNTIVAGIISSNPFGCTSYQYGSETMPAVEATKSSFTARFVYQDLEANTIGTTSVKCPDAASYAAIVTAVPAATAINTAIGATAVHAEETDSFSATLKCHDASGELYTLTITRDRMTLASYEDDTIRATVEAWADTVPALA